MSILSDAELEADEFSSFIVKTQLEKESARKGKIVVAKWAGAADRYLCLEAPKGDDWTVVRHRAKVFPTEVAEAWASHFHQNRQLSSLMVGLVCEEVITEEI